MSEEHRQIVPETLMLPACTRFRPSAADELLAECAAYGGVGAVVHGASLRASGAWDRLAAGAPDGLVAHEWTHAGGEPTLAQVDALRAWLKEREVRWVAAVGGGSVIDLAKAAAGLMDSPAPTLQYHDGFRIPPARVPFVAAPTTAGTGSECTPVAVLTNSASGEKKSIRHSSFTARLVVLDPDLLAGCPRPTIAASGMDAFTQAVESFVSRNASWISDMPALKAMGLIACALEPVWRGDTAARGDLLLGSYLAGLALTNARLGLVHGLAHPLGARYHVPHGLVCAVCLPPVIEFNRRAMRAKYDQASAAVGGDLLAKIRNWLSVLQIRSPFAGKPVVDRDGIVRETLASGSTAANPEAVGVEDVSRLLDRIFQPL